jgi:hypothetical protein
MGDYALVISHWSLVGAYFYLYPFVFYLFWLLVNGQWSFGVAVIWPATVTGHWCRIYTITIRF